MDFSYVHIRYFIGYVYHICLQDTIQSTLSLCLRCQAMLLPMPLRPLLLTTRSGFNLLPEYPILKTLKEGRSFVDDGGVQWARTASHLYREEVICVPSTHVKSMGRWAHKTNGHPGVQRTRLFFEKHFYTTLSQERLNEVLREVCMECSCSKAKQSTSADQGLTAHLPIPRMVNSVLYLDFTEMPKYSGHDFALLVTCGLSRYTRVFPLTKRCNGETVLKELFEGWIQAYGMPKRIHSDRDIRFTSNTGWYTGVLKNMGVEVDFGTPNYKRKNTHCERQIKAFKAITRILLAEESSRNWIKLVPVAVYMMNNQISSRTGYAPTELFLGREAGSDPRGHLGVTWGVYLCAGKPPLADIILSHPPELTRCDSVIGLAIPAMSGHIQNRGIASGDLYIGISGINRVLLS